MSFGVSVEFKQPTHGMARPFLYNNHSKVNQKKNFFYRPPLKDIENGIRLEEISNVSGLLESWVWEMPKVSRISQVLTEKNTPVNQLFNYTLFFLVTTFKQILPTQSKFCNFWNVFAVFLFFFFFFFFFLQFVLKIDKV
jgi:hypothetical protein